MRALVMFFCVVATTAVAQDAAPSCGATQCDACMSTKGCGWCSSSKSCGRLVSGSSRMFDMPTCGDDNFISRGPDYCALVDEAFRDRRNDDLIREHTADGWAPVGPPKKGVAPVVLNFSVASGKCYKVAVRYRSKTLLEARASVITPDLAMKIGADSFGTSGTHTTEKPVSAVVLTLGCPPKQGTGTLSFPPALPGEFDWQLFSRPRTADGAAAMAKRVQRLEESKIGPTCKRCKELRRYCSGDSRECVRSYLRCFTDRGYLPSDCP